MGVIVHLNDVLSKTTLEKRMEYAFGKDGTDFWKKFFLCKNHHSGEKIIYLFTQPQLKIMDDWLKHKMRTLGEEIQKNLDFSQQDFFNQAIADKPRTPYGYFEGRTCYLFYKDNEPNIIETFRFSSSPPEKEKKGWDEFFDKEFIKKLSNESMRGNDREKIVSDFVQLRQKIADKILPPDESKWLHYLGEKITANEHKMIEYCLEKPSDFCPLVAFVVA